jgi:hypothetical protein
MLAAGTAFEEKRATQRSPSYNLMERVRGIEPPQSAWKAEVLPLNYTRI